MIQHPIRYNILNDCQHGFRAKRSCETQILTLYHELASSLDNKVLIDMIILDFSKAFDRVPHQRLPKKVHHYDSRQYTSMDLIITELQNTASTSRGTVVGESSSG